ncbi:MAG: 4-hydroxy-2-oxoglutarate aldolase [Thermomicrobiales bacterium]|nr:4-hydroxy-2-oxoglutarate aldolase [Thermomicrobiales bacterium]
MTASRIPEGVFAPVATTFDEAGDLDLEAFRSNLSWYATAPLDGVVILGSNGEYALLEADEKLRLIEAGVEAIGGRKVVMAGTGVESTRGTIELTRRAAALGIDYALIVTPHYYKSRYDRAAYLAHYRAVADASPVPILIYIMTAYTGIDLASALVSELSSHPNIAGIKDSGGNAPKVGEMIAGAAPGFAVLAGSASFLYPALCLGATGGILALANVAPTQCKEIERCFRAGNHEAARALQLRMLAPNAAVTGKHGIPGLKVALESVGLKGGLPRPPMLPLGESDAEDVRRTLREAGIGPIG